jgi:hypothetical protein
MITLIDKIDVFGISGRHYVFEVYNFGAPFPIVQGIYEFVQFKNAIYYAKYIGESGDFSDRIYINLTKHEALECAKKHGATHIAVMKTTGLTRQQRISIETDIRKNYPTPCNKQ